ncbi:hypothetical protein YT1_3105 [Rhodococcus ruber]|nr:hypothetical protein YT1_3105 [Rhodococcus ruber]
MGLSRRNGGTADGDTGGRGEVDDDRTSGAGRRDAPAQAAPGRRPEPAAAGGTESGGAAPTLCALTSGSVP